MRLGHIIYSNCFPVHARLIDRPLPTDPELVEGIPSSLNLLLSRGEIDVSPCSSIEFARHADRYTILPDLVIGSSGPVRSIMFLCDRSPDELQGCTVAVPSASATSVVLLKILLQLRWKASARFVWFDQRVDDPFAAGASAALFIGDVALQPDLYTALPVRLDLGTEWTDHSELPFAFAVWQAVGGSTPALRELHSTLIASRSYGLKHRQALAERHQHRFGMPPHTLAEYWDGLRYDLNPAMMKGLELFYRQAVEIGELEAAPDFRWSF
ncbi:menaquinone biosynthesis protein [soil metagenome]